MIGLDTPTNNLWYRHRQQPLVFAEGYHLWYRLWRTPVIATTFGVRRRRSANTTYRLRRTTEFRLLRFHFLKWTGGWWSETNTTKHFVHCCYCLYFYKNEYKYELYKFSLLCKVCKLCLLELWFLFYTLLRN